MDREWILLNPGPANTTAGVRQALVMPDLCIIYAGQGEIATYGFRVANMGTLTPADMTEVVAAFAASLAEVRQAGAAPSI